MTGNGNQTFCRSENFARLVVPGFSSSSTSTSSSISLRRDKVFHWSQQIRQVTAKLQVIAAKDVRETATQNVQCSTKDYIHFVFLLEVTNFFTKHNCGPEMTDIFSVTTGLFVTLWCVTCV